MVRENTAEGEGGIQVTELLRGNLKSWILLLYGIKTLLEGINRAVVTPDRNRPCDILWATVLHTGELQRAKRVYQTSSSQPARRQTQKIAARRASSRTICSTSAIISWPS